MSELELTKEERETLRRWFRQAISKVETEEVSAMLLKRDGIKVNEEGSHRAATSRQRTRRNRLRLHGREVQLV